jgi:ankyrin repeat protein
MPNEMLLLVAQSLSCQKDISALSRTDWTLYHLLNTYLYEYNVQHHNASGLAWVIKRGNCSLTKKFLDAGANIALFGCHSMVARPDEANPNPLVSAARLSPHLAVLKVLLFETRPDQICSQRQLINALRWAIKSQTQDVFELIMTDQPSFRRVSASTGSLLHFALRLGTEPIIECLLQKGAKPPPKRQRIMFDIAAERRDNSLLQLLRHDIRPGSTWILEKLASVNNITSLQHLIDVGAEIAVYGHAAVFRAIYHGHLSMVEFLIQNGANPHLSCALYEYGGRSTIGYAIGYKKLSIVKLLLDKGVQPDRHDLQLANRLKLSEAVAILEKLSFQDLPERTSLVEYTQQREAERLDDPGFYRMDWGHWSNTPPVP